MAYSTLKDAIAAVIKTNGNNEITGALLQQSLFAMIDSLGANYQFAGVADPSTNPGTPDQKVFYLATESGTYPNFGGVELKTVGVFYWDGSAWSVKQTGIPFLSSVAASIYYPTKFDITPDGTGYYSAGGVITPLYTYRRKAIDVTGFAGKLVLIRAGYIDGSGNISLGAYNFIKKADNSYISLISCVTDVPNIDTKNVRAFLLPTDAVELQLSWDYGQLGTSAFVMVGMNDETTQAIYMNTSDNVNYVGTPNNYFNGLTPFKILFVWLHNRPVGNVTFNIAGTGAKPVYVLTEKGIERLSEKTQNASTEFYYVLYDSGADRYVVRKLSTPCFDYPVKRFDMTPDGSGYYSAGGVITAFKSYNRKAFDVTAYAGKRLRVRVGYGIQDGTKFFTAYSFVKLSDNSFVTLKSCEADSPFVNDVCADVILPSNAVELQCSWDAGVNVLPENAFIFYDEFYNYAVELYSLNIPTVLNYVGNNIFKSFDVTPDGTGYYSAGGVISPLYTYRHKAFDLSQYKGKTLRCKFGYPNYPAGWSWIKYDNDTYSRLDGVGYKDGDEWVFVVPQNIAELEASWDVGSGVVPYMYYDADLQGQIDELRELIDKPLVGKTIFLFGDSISSDDYTWYRDKLAAITGATVLNQGASGRNAAYQASNEYFQRLANNPNDIVVVLVGGNDSGASGTIGTFDANSPLGQMGESVVQETDISVDYNGNTFIQAISHIIRKWRSIYWNFRLNAGLTAHILDTENDNAVVYPASGTATELQCINYAAAQGWTLGYGQRYVMMTTETVESKQAKLSAVRQPKMFICTTLPQRRYNAGSYWSNPENWERKRLACIECAEKYGMPLIDLAKEFAIDWDVEPYWPGQGYTGTSKTDNQGVYTMDGLHPNEFGYEYISQIVAKHLVK